VIQELRSVFLTASWTLVPYLDYIARACKTGGHPIYRESVEKTGMNVILLPEETLG
jgi:hypothetical protein